MVEGAGRGGRDRSGGVERACRGAVARGAGAGEAMPPSLTPMDLHAIHSDPYLFPLSISSLCESQRVSIKDRVEESRRFVLI